MWQSWIRASRPRLLFVVAAISVVTLAASSPIYSAVSGRHAIGHTSTPPIAATGGTSSKPDCSEATARQLVDEHHLNAFLLPNPVRQLLCGPFTGPGSEAMAITIGAPTCWGIQRWAVFSFTGGAWRLVLDESEFISSPLVAVGADIQVTTPVFRNGDPRCIPSGGNHARIWHWDGTRFTAGPWKQATPSKPRPKTVPKRRQNTVHLFYVSSPSHNLWCDVGDEERVYCVSAKLPHSVTLTSDGAVTICSGPRCVGNTKLFKPGDPVLAYGQQDEQGPYRCRSETTGITCTVIAPGKGFGKGFLINSAGVRRVRA